MANIAPQKETPTLTKHGVSLACTCLAIAEDGPILTQQKPFHKTASRILENFLLRALRSMNSLSDFCPKTGRIGSNRANNFGCFWVFFLFFNVFYCIFGVYIIPKWLINDS